MVFCARTPSRRAYDAKYSGIRIIFGCTGEDDAAAAAEARPAAEHGEMHQWFGDGCYTLVYTGGGAEA